MIAKIFVSPSADLRILELTKELELAELKREHPDVLYISSDQKLGIEQARGIKDFFSLKPYQAKGRAVVVEDLSTITVDSQNALLKILEEPPAEAIILFGTTSTNQLLPTVLSRCQVILLDPEGNPKSDFPEIKKLLALDTIERFRVIEKTDDKNQLLKDLLHFTKQEFERNHTKVDEAKKLLAAESWQRSNVNVRGILEYLMLVLPKK